jgi:hypothetical protein
MNQVMYNIRIQYFQRKQMDETFTYRGPSLLTTANTIFVAIVDGFWIIMSKQSVADDSFIHFILRSFMVVEKVLF